MAELLVGPVIEKLIDTGFQYLKDQFRWQTGMKKELERLQENYDDILAVVEYASILDQIKDKNPKLNKWLWKLRDAIDEADDVMGELEYLKLKKDLTKTKKQGKVRYIMKSVNEKLIKIVKRALKIDPILKRLEKVVKKLDKISAGFTTFLDLAKEAKQDNQEQLLEFNEARETGSLPKNVPIGRDKEEEFVMKWLRKTSNDSQTSNEYQSTFYSNISLLSIVGQGGMGKTTLLQQVYKEEIRNEFDLKLWVCVSNNFSVTKVIADMLESTKNERPRLDTLNRLQETLKSTVDTKKFLLVLDDVWEEEDVELNTSKWEKVLAPLASGKLGSKILVTTRLESVALMISNIINKKNEVLRLEGLKKDDCLLLLNRYAFANVDSLHAFHNLRSISEKIVEKLCGSPLAARVIGGVLRSHLNESHWRSVLNYEIGSHKGIMNILKLSYVFLPKILQICLSFCCTFPQDYMLHKDDLVRMWTALGFIQPPTNSSETMKDVGERYFDILVKKSLFDEFQTKYETYYQLHDLLHEMLRVVSAQQYFSIVDDEELQTPENIRHLFVKTSNLSLLRKVEKFKNLHSIILFYLEDCEDFIGVLAKIFKTLRSIRLMYINAPKLKQMPEEIGDLIHLRYLRIFNRASLTRLPRSLSNLYHLQFMIYNQDHMFFRGGYLRVDGILPKDMNNLPNLHYLEVPFPGIYEIGKLNSLKELDGFYVQNKDGYRIEELQHMNELRVLKINFHENLNDAKDAYNAKLCDKRNLIDLSLNCDYDGSNTVVGLNENALDNLQPHSSLKKLKINCYMGIRPAIWMNDVNLFSNLEFIKFQSCRNLQTLPPFWKLPFLKYLYLDNMPEVKGFDYEFHGNDKVCVFQSLLVLDIFGLQALENLFVATSASYECFFPCLIQLRLLFCPNLQEFPSLPPKLEKLEMYKIKWKGCNWLQGISSYCSISIQDCPNLIFLKGHQEMDTTEKCQLILSKLVINDPSLLLMVPLTSVTSIQKLGIKYNDAVISFPIEVEQWFLHVSSSVCELEFKSLKSLKSLPSSLESFSSLKILHVEWVPMLQLLPNMPASLIQLELVKLESLQSLPSSLESLSSLKILHVEEVPLLQQLPNMPRSLEELDLFALESIQSLPPSLDSLPSLKILHVKKVLMLEQLPTMPASLEQLKLVELESLQCLPPLSSSLKLLDLNTMPLQELPDLPPSLCKLYLINLCNLRCLPSGLLHLSSLTKLHVNELLQLRDLPDLPLSLKSLRISDCHPDLMERYQRIKGSDWHKIAHIPDVHIY